MTSSWDDPDPTQSEANEFRERALGGDGGGGNSGGYIAQAVHFSIGDSNGLNSVNPLIATDNEFFSVSFWQKDMPGGPEHVNSHELWYTQSSNAPAADIKSNPLEVGPTDFYFSSLDGNNWLDVVSSPYQKAVWHHFLLCVDAGHIGMSMRAVLYVDDVLDTGAVKEADGAAFIHNMNGNLFSAIRGRFQGDIADFRVMPGVSLLDVGGDISLATRRLFIDDAGKPVDPAVATAALGVPCILFSGDAVGFPVNQGNGGPFEIWENALIDATTSPSDDPPPYHASAVHFATDSFLISDILINPSNRFMSISYWVNFGGLSPGGSGTLFACSGSFGSWNAPAAPYFGNYSSDGNTYLDSYTSSNISLTGWHSVIMSIDVTNAEVAVILIDGVVVPILFAGWTEPFDIALVGAFFVGGDGTELSAKDLSDIRIAPAQNWLTSGTISPETLALFIDAEGKPVDPAVATAALGVPAILFSGDADTFPVNQGSGGVFTLTGTLTNATTSPSD